MILNKLVALATLAAAAAVTDVEAGTHVRRAVDDGEDTDATQRNLGFLSSSSGKGKGGSKGSSTGGGSSSGPSGSKTSKSSKSSGGKGGSKGSSSSSDPSKSESSSSGGDLGGGNTGESASDDGGGSTSNSASGSGTSRPTDFVLAALEENNKYCIAAKEVKSGKELEIVNCDRYDKKQLWIIDSEKRWRPKKDLDLCVEVSGNIFSKMQNPWLKKCNGGSDQKWNVNKKGDNEISPVMGRSVCVTYDTNSPSSGDTIELDRCNGNSEQGWKIVEA